MKCPKCNCDISDKMLVCPNCRKVLKLVCPKCNSINKSNICQKCGFTIIDRCHNCGKINKTTDEKCSKCGFSTYASVAINSSIIDEFACITIDFPNINKLKSALGSAKLFEKFKLNLDAMVASYVHENELSREILNGLYVIRFNKDNSFTESATHAMNTAIEILNLVTKLNFKLSKLSNLLLQCNITLIKRDINALPDAYKSGFNVTILYDSKKQTKLTSCLQVIVESHVFDALGGSYSLKPFSSVMVQNQKVMFYELSVKKYVKIPKDEDKISDITDVKTLPNINKTGSKQNEMFNIDAINFEELKVNFINTTSQNLIAQILLKLQEKTTNLISIRAAYNLAPKTYNLLNAVKNLNKFKNVFKVTCHDDLKYESYGFFKELISDICNFSKSTKNYPLHRFDMFENIDPEKYIFNLINSQIKAGVDADTARWALLEIFFNIFSSIKGSLIFIEDIHNIDDSSYEILKMFFEKIDELQISYVITADEKFSLHKDSSFLLASASYTEIMVNPANINDILKENPAKYINIADSYYMKKIAQHFSGSQLYFELALDYLIDSDVLAINTANSLCISEQKNIFIPLTIDDLLERQIISISKDENAYKLLLLLLFMGPRLDFGTIELCKIKETNVIIKKLINKKIIYANETSVCVNNYNLYKNIFVEKTGKDIKQKMAKELLNVAFDEQTPTYPKAILYNILEDKQKEFATWAKLSEVNKSLGDFSAYVNCGNKFLELADKNPELIAGDYRKEFYENISILMHKYSPEKQQGLLQDMLVDFEDSGNNEKVITLYSKMLQGYLQTGNYQQAFNAICKISENFPNLANNIHDKNSSTTLFFISLIKIEILFSIGNFKDCIDVALDILKSSETLLKLKPEYLSQPTFVGAIFDALSFAALAKVILLHDDVHKFLALIQNKIGSIPITFELFILLQESIHGTQIDVIPDYPILHGDRFSKILTNILVAFNVNQDNFEAFAGNLHKAKIKAKANKLFTIEFMCDLLIGYSYFKLNKNKKAMNIYNDVLEASEKKGVKPIAQLALYLIALLKFEEQNYDYAIQIANNAVIKIEQDENSSDFLFFLFKLLLGKIFSCNNSADLAELCFNDAKSIQNKHGLNFDLEKSSF